MGEYRFNSFEADVKLLLFCITRHAVHHFHDTSVDKCVLGAAMSSLCFGLSSLVRVLRISFQSSSAVGCATVGTSAAVDIVYLV